MDVFLNHFFKHLCLKNLLQIGKTKVFLRAGQMAELDARRAEVLGGAAKIIQRRIRTHYARKQFIALREAAVCIQASLRGKFSKLNMSLHMSYNCNGKGFLVSYCVFG